MHDCFKKEYNEELEFDLQIGHAPLGGGGYTLLCLFFKSFHVELDLFVQPLWTERIRVLK